VITQNVGSYYSAFTVHSNISCLSRSNDKVQSFSFRELGAIRAFPAIEATPGTKAEKFVLPSITCGAGHSAVEGPGTLL
jgi:hypothetical protein